MPRPARSSLFSYTTLFRSHKRWIGDIESTQGTKMNFPILGDADRKVSNLYAMIHPEANDTLTVRSVFFIDPKKKVRAIITRSEEHTSELQSLTNLVCRLLLDAETR